MRLYSAAIIGASPAGCAAAITLARQGLKVLVIDASEFADNCVDSPSPHSTRPKGQTCRARHQSFMAVAQAQGAEVWKACRVDAAILEEGELMGLATEHGTVRAYHILDASGQRQWLSQQLGIPTRLFSPYLVAQRKPMTWQIRDRFAGPGWFLLGEAAAHPDSATSSGWIRAFTYRLQSVISGLYAARAIADCEQGKISEALAAQRYSQWLQTRFIRSSIAQRSQADGSSLSWPGAIIRV